MLINKEEHNELCVGIDLGTTNSVLATVNLKANGDIVSKVVDISRAVDIYNSVTTKAKLSTQKKPLLPSCVYYREEQGYEPLVGDFAKIQYPLRPQLVAKSIKSQMGKKLAVGLADAVPDKTPAQVSARILQHLLQEAGRIYRTKLEDVVITVPANFDAAMCKATRDAAALAGVKVLNDDGSERAVLLSEPNAVIYDLINQVQNGEISEKIIDFNSEKNVLVFDLGGGTLDITLHKIKRREDCPDVLKVDEIAANRYTLLGGDDFDEALAQEMYRRYLQQYAAYPDIVRQIRQQEQAVLPQLVRYAEELKLELSERMRSQAAASDSFGWDDDDKFFVGGNMGGIGYAYDDSFSQEEIENILQPFMGADLKFDDYKIWKTLPEGRNIIYPVLDVLQKAAVKLAAEPRVDAVVVNGGMSKFYMVTERLQAFFGMEPIVALDPDQSVARGAAVYHYYLHKYAEQMQEDMRLLGDTSLPEAVLERRAAGAGLSRKAFRPAAIEWGKQILNESLYLGMRNGETQELIAAGSELPYKAETLKGFKLAPQQREVAIPIKRKISADEYMTIASGRVTLDGSYDDGAYVSIDLQMNANKLLKMEMTFTSDYDGENILESQQAEISVGYYSDDHALGRESRPINNKGFKSGAAYDPYTEIKWLKQQYLQMSYCNHYSLRSPGSIRKDIQKRIKKLKKAANPEEFAWPLIDELKRSQDANLRMHLLLLARYLAPGWNSEQLEALAKICLEQLSLPLGGYHYITRNINVNIQAILALGVCGSKAQLLELNKLRDLRSYQDACLYAFSLARIEHAWIFDKVRDCVYNGANIGWLGNRARALGISLRKGKEEYQIPFDENEAAVALCCVINNNYINEYRQFSGLYSSLFALGYICDQRWGYSKVDAKTLEYVRFTLEQIPQNYSGVVVRNLLKKARIVRKMIEGTALTEAEEEYLLEKMEIGCSD
ncbi:MAG: Hsp70 family protein [Phascolarctobacterium sp.]|uniref:Hsp70 family protein n=1 Tax=Phascolarctobacterium sp. TaxID=2049039 RepID=UPI0026DD3AB9|nr:Hsp70 family protein [Phascolarctobacterium sp.]MDO4922198.1 Hsp70 family protein [Phascolarctobacterium sp.]